MNKDQAQSCNWQWNFLCCVFVFIWETLSCCSCIIALKRDFLFKILQASLRSVKVLDIKTKAKHNEI